MRHHAARALLALALFLALQFATAADKKAAPASLHCAPGQAVSAAKAGAPAGDERRTKAPLHPSEANQYENHLAKQIDSILAQPPLERAHWGIDVVDLASAKTIFTQNAEQLFIPASNTKLFTTAAALAIAGPDFRFRTTVEAEGKIDSHGRLLGDLVIVGRGDPNISGRALPYALKTQRTPPHTQILEDMADQVARSGLKLVDGDLIGDDTYYAFERYGEGWAQDDLQWIDGAPVSALSFNDNVIFLNIQPAGQAGDKAVITLEPETNYYEIENRIVTSPVGIAKKVGIHREPGARKIVLWGSLPLGDPGMKEPLAIEDPAEFVAELFRAMLEKRGIVVRGHARARHGDVAQFFDQLPIPQIPPRAGSENTVAPPGNSCCGAPAQPAPGAELQPANKVLAEHLSPPLLDDIRVINKTSQNLHAELALRLVGRLTGAGGSFEGGAAAVKQFLLQAGLKEDEFIFLDGSGLSRRDLVTPAATVQLLLYASRQPWGAAFQESLPVSGVDGSLAERFLNTPAGGLVHAKTGSLSHVNALSGYGETKQGRKFVFSIFCNNYNAPATKALAAIDAVVQLLVAQGDADKGRVSIAPGGTFEFQQLKIAVLAIRAADSAAATSGYVATIRVQDGDAAKEMTVSPPESFNWHRYHVAIPAVHGPGEAGDARVELAVATVASLPQCMGKPIGKDSPWPCR